MTVTSSAVPMEAIESEGQQRRTLAVVVLRQWSRV